MKERFEIREMFISPVTLTKEGNVRIDLNYPTRFCVIDNENEIAIDIKTKLKYDYLKTQSKLYVLNKTKEQIKNNSRVAIFPYASMLSVLPIEYDINQAQNIIHRLKNGEYFEDGNEIFDNEQYLEYLQQEENNQIQKDTSNQKTKKLRKKLK